jgi:hypothetical protein
MNANAITLQFSRDVVDFSRAAAAPVVTSVPMTSPELESRAVLLNGKVLALTDQDRLPALSGEALPSRNTVFAPASITFVALPNANNAACTKP